MEPWEPSVPEELVAVETLPVEVEAAAASLVAAVAEPME
jgi:hypothetical protein